MKQTLWTIADLFKDRILAVPDYQRGYSWDEEQLRDLMDDVEMLRPRQVHYLGTVVLHEQAEEVRDEAKDSHVVHHVVDGQQRLTSITILLEALRRELVALEGEGSAVCETLRRTYLWVVPPKSITRIPKLRLHGELGDHFESHILREGGGLDGARLLPAQRLDTAKRFFAKYFREERESRGEDFPGWLDELLEKVTKQLKTTLFSVESEADVGVIFEVMNNRGKPLSELEKVKNYLIFVAAKIEADGLARQINKTWAKLLTLLMEGELVQRGDEDRLLRTHWLLTQNHEEKKWDGYRSIKARFDLRTHESDDQRLVLQEDIGGYLRTLEETVVALSDIDRPARPGAFAQFAHEPELYRELVDWTERLHRIGVLATFHPFLAAVRMRHRDPSAYLDAVKACELFSFLTYRVTGCRSNAGRTSFNWLGRQVFLDEEPMDQAIARVGRWTGGYCKQSTYDYFWKLDEQNPRDFYRWGGLRYMLYEWERHRVGNKHVHIAWKALHDREPKKTIEHVLPQTANDPYWTSRFDEQAITLFTHDLGNLSLTEDNSSYGNKPFPRKRGEAGVTHACYAKSLLVTEQDLARWDVWTPDTIRERRAEMVAWAQSRWPHPGADAVDQDVLAGEAEEEA